MAEGGRRILVVEDEHVVADLMAQCLMSRGFGVVGPAASVQDAMALLNGDDAPDAATLDINLRGEMVFPVADRLLMRGVPFVFTTGYDVGGVPERFSHVRLWTKPVDVATLADALLMTGIVGSGRGVAG